MRNQHGYSLIEILVSVVVLSLGLLGLAGLQTTSMRFNHDGYLRSVALTQVSAMLDRMRANTAGIEAGNYNALSGASSDPGCSTCSPANTAQKDLFDWNTTNTNALPNGQGDVAGDGTFFTIRVMWDNDRTGATGTNCSGNSAVDLSCITVNVRL